MTRNESHMLSFKSLLRFSSFCSSLKKKNNYNNNKKNKPNSTRSATLFLYIEENFVLYKPPLKKLLKKTWIWWTGMLSSTQHKSRARQRHSWYLTFFFPSTRCFETSIFMWSFMTSWVKAINAAHFLGHNTPIPFKTSCQIAMSVFTQNNTSSKNAWHLIWFTSCYVAD